MIQIAYLIEAHTDVEQLIRLSDALLLSGDVFIHVDRKTKDDSFWNKLRGYSLHKENIHILEDRVSVAWAGFSQVRAFFKLLAAALNGRDKFYDRFVLLSGLDYPVWNPERIKTFFENNKDREFVCGYNITKCPYDYQLRKIKYYHFFRDIPLPHKSFLRRLIVGGTAILLKYIGIHRRPVMMIKGKPYDVYFGSSWISITRECALFLMEQFVQEDGIKKYFSTVYAPDELCVPTLVMNSKFAKNAILVEDLSFQGVTPLHYLNYEDCIWSYDEKDYDTIVGSGKMFVRKIVSGKSERLVEMIKQSWKEC